MKQSAGTIQLELYEDSINMCGVAKVTLPEIAYVCTTLTGAGLMGNLEVPYIGMIDNMTMSVEWDSPTGHAVQLLEPKKHQLDLWVAEEFWDTEEVEENVWADKYVALVRPKAFSPGMLAPMTSPGTKSEFVVYRFAAYRDGEQRLEIDKRNQKFVVDGKDYWEKVRKALGK